MAEWEEFGADRVGRYYLVGDEEEAFILQVPPHRDGMEAAFCLVDHLWGLLSQAEICQWLHPTIRLCKHLLH